MGNLEKAGVLVVVALLAVILVVAFLNFPDQNAKGAPVLSASGGKIVGELKNAKPRPEAVNVYPETTPPAIDPAPVKTDPPPPQEDWKILPEPRPAEPEASQRDVPGVAADTSKNAKPAPPEIVNEKPATPPSTPGYPKTVKVQSGDTLWLIAVREYGPKVGPGMLGLIADANPKVRPEALKTGSELSLPAPSPELTDAKMKPEADRAVKKPAGATGDKKPPAPKPQPAKRLPFVPN